MFASLLLSQWILLLLVPIGAQDQYSYWQQWRQEPSTTSTFIIDTRTLIVTQASPCYVTVYGKSVTDCRRKRGIEEIPEILGPDAFIFPSTVEEMGRIGITTWTLPPNEPVEESSTQPEESYDDEEEVTLYSSMTEETRTLLPPLDPLQVSINNLLGTTAASKLVTVGKECGGQTVNLSQLLSCLGAVVETTTLTATYTTTMTTTIGFSTIIVGGCTPSGFPYTTCPGYRAKPPPVGDRDLLFTLLPDSPHEQTVPPETLDKLNDLNSNSSSNNVAVDTKKNSIFPNNFPLGGNNRIKYGA